MIAVGGAPTFAATNACLDAPVPAGLEPFRWTGAAGTDLWQTDGNWLGQDAPTNRDAALGWVCIDAAHDVDPDDVVYIVPESQNPGTANTAATSAVIQAIDVKSGTLSINRAGKLLLYGDQDARPSFVRDGAELRLTMGYLGGPGLLNMDGDMIWSTQQFSSSMVSSCGVTGIGNCPTSGVTEGPGRMMVGGTLTVQKLVDDGVSRGVNLADDYELAVAGEGDVRIVGRTYIAQARSASIDIAGGGTLTFDGDGHVFEGSFEGRQVPPPFVNAGTVQKIAGEGVSSITTAYQETGEGKVVVNTGSISIPLAPSQEGQVAGGSELATGRCEASADGGIPSGGDDVPLPECVPTTAANLQQVAAVAIPGAATDGVNVRIQRLNTLVDPRDLQPPVRIDVGTLPGGTSATIDLGFDRTIRQLPAKREFDVFRKRADGEYEQLPHCNKDAGHSYPNGVTACVIKSPDGPRVSGRSGLELRVRAQDPSASYVVRRVNRVIIVPTRDGRLVPDRNSSDQMNNAAALLRPLELTSDTACGVPADTAWRLERRWRNVDLNDHAIGWFANGPGEAKGLQARMGDLAQLQGWDVGLEVIEGQLSGVVRVRRNESTSTYWVGEARVGVADAPFAGIPGEPRWRILDGTPLVLTWRKVVGGQIQQSGIEATIADLLRDHSPAKVAGADPDVIGFGFGCAGEDVVIDDFRVFRTGGGRDDQYDLEAPMGVVALRGTLPRTYCLTSARDHPNPQKVSVRLSHRDRWRVFWRADGNGNESELSHGLADRRRLRIPFRVVREGQVAIKLSGTPDIRTSSSGWWRTPAMPVIKLRQVTNKVPVGGRIRLKGTIRLGGGLGDEVGRRTVELFVLGPGDRFFHWRKGSRVQTKGDGDFTFGFKAPAREGKLALAVRVVGERGIGTTMSNRAVRVAVFKPHVPDGGNDQPPLRVPIDTEPVFPPTSGFTSSDAVVCRYRLG